MSFASARIAAGFTQTEAARRLEVNQSTVSYWESGKKFPRGPMLAKAADLYGCTVDELLGRAPAGA